MLNNRDIKPAEFLRAVSCGGHPENLDIIRRYLEAHKGNADLINARDSNGMTALMCAAKNDYTSIVNILLASPDVQVNAYNSREGDYTALHYATLKNHTAIVKALLAAPDINVNAFARNAGTPLMISILNCRDNMSTINVLLTARDIDLNISNYDDTVLTLAILLGETSLLKILLDYKGENAINEHTIAMTEKRASGWIGSEAASLLNIGRKNIKKNQLEPSEAKASSIQTSSANQGDEKDKIIFELTNKLKAMEALFETFTKGYSELAGKKAAPAPLKLFDQQTQKSESSSSVSLPQKTR